MSKTSPTLRSAGSRGVGKFREAGHLPPGTLYCPAHGPMEFFVRTMVGYEDPTCHKDLARRLLCRCGRDLKVAGARPYRKGEV